jgi:hypothetical protein
MAMTGVQVVRVLDHGTLLQIGFDDCVRYHGRTSIGGVALGLRLVRLALADLAPGRVPERAEIAVRTAFPGPGFADAVEMITRAVSRGAYTVDEALASDDAPVAVVGRLWFEVAVAERRRAYVVPPGAMSDEFVRVGRAVEAGGADAATEQRWTELKERLAIDVLAAPDQALFRAA